MPEIWPDEPDDESEEAIGLAYWWPLVDFDVLPDLETGLINSPEAVP